MLSLRCSVRLVAKPSNCRVHKCCCLSLRRTGEPALRLLTLLFQRFLIFSLGVFSVWIIVFVVFEDADSRLPWFLALVLTYGIAAYVILPVRSEWA